MPLSLYPFPDFYHPPFGVADRLPYCRDGVRRLAPGELLRYPGPTFPELHIRRHLNGATSRGLCGLLPATAFLGGEVRPHEATLASRLDRQEQLVTADAGALGKPVLLTAPSLRDWWAERDRTHHATGRDVAFDGEDNFYRLRSYERRDGRTTRPLPLDGLEPLCIADGHHRAATHARLAARGVAACAYVPVCLVGADELHIGAFLRVVSAPPLAPDLLTGLAPYFAWEALPAAVAPARVGDWLLVHAGRPYRLRRRVDPAGRTDVRWLDQEVLPAVFGIADTRTDPRIAFARIPDTTDGSLPYAWSPELVYLLGFPLPRQRFFAEVGAGRLLPPKSTRFEPRVPSGMVVWKP